VEDKEDTANLSGAMTIMGCRREKEVAEKIVKE